MFELNTAIPISITRGRKLNSILILFCYTGRTRTKDKYRVVYTDLQRLELEKEFHFNRYITITRKTELSKMLSLSERQVRTIFYTQQHFTVG